MMMIGMDRGCIARRFLVRIRRRGDDVTIDVDDFHRVRRPRFGHCRHDDAAEQQRNREDKTGKESRHGPAPIMNVPEPQSCRSPALPMLSGQHSLSPLHIESAMPYAL